MSVSCTIVCTPVEEVCSRSFYVTVSQVWPQERTQERLWNTKFIISQALETGGMPQHAGPPGEASAWSGGRKQERGESLARIGWFE